MTTSSKLCLAISSFRHDRQVLSLLEGAAPLVPSLFFKVVVVDSLGTGLFPELLKARNWSWVDYHCLPGNLGSAGNLAKRLQLAGDLGADYVYALNHDGVLDGTSVRQMLLVAVSTPKLGAVYPLRRLANREGMFDVTGLRRVPLVRRGIRRQPRAKTLDVYWGSSNGTLYSTAPAKQGILPWADLWMGWEDLAYGWLLHKRGFRQLVATQAIFTDSYEFARVPGAPSSVRIAKKPAWYAYYHVRNLLIAAIRTRQGIGALAAVAARIGLEAGLTVLFRTEKRRRLQLMAKGFWDALSQRGGMVVPPSA